MSTRGVLGQRCRGRRGKRLGGAGSSPADGHAAPAPPPDRRSVQRVLRPRRRARGSGGRSRLQCGDGGPSLGGESPGGGQPAPVFLPENRTDRGAWWAAVHGVTESGIRLSEHTGMRARSHSPCGVPGAQGDWAGTCAPGREGV